MGKLYSSNMHEAWLLLSDKELRHTLKTSAQGQNAIKFRSIRGEKEGVNANIDKK